MQKIRDILLYLLFLSLNFEIWDPFNTNGDFSIVKLFGILYILSFFIYPFKKTFTQSKNEKFFTSPILLFFLLLTFINLLNINDLSNSIIDYQLLQWYIVLIVIINHTRLRPKIIEKAMFAFAIGSIILSLCYFANIGITIELDGRLRLFGDNENSIGMRMAISSIYLIYNANKNYLKQGSSRFLLLLFLPIMIILLIKTASRISLIICFLMILVYFFMLEKKKFKIKFYSWSFLISFLTFLIIQVKNSETIMTRLLKSVNEYDISGRDIIWSKLFPTIIDNPIIGIGQTGYEKFSTHVFGVLVSPHNFIIEVLCYSGIVGLSVFFIFYFRLIRKSLLLYKKCNDIYPVLLLISIFGFILTGQVLHVKLLYCAYAYIIVKCTSYYDGKVTKQIKIPLKK